ncbi:SH2B adapter protein 2 isoform X2 [Alosa sapidissima]|uniref:SH2B adapter protein 2 isoform X2 n=1 Tax=Alosa sapidissima TaxID=34773 RepID=UPI001C09CDA3|nr:SH2B adapter protein 2 isoform X2 [Alosa sapidissima]XP_041924062.1 SH2B adapter protein 2 isoform X2 [Alosa sapidissima]XP_041924063.1 SH2B adapter protein 2 isoform X2 [Alosa sapidissima]
MSGHQQAGSSCPELSPSCSSCPLPDWTEFCEVHARASAVDFAAKFRQFVQENPTYDTAGADASFAQRYTHAFLSSFNAALHVQPPSTQPGGASSTPQLPATHFVPFAGLQVCPLPFGQEGFPRRREASSESLDSMDSGGGGGAYAGGGSSSSSSSSRQPAQQKAMGGPLGQSRSSEDVSLTHTHTHTHPRQRFRKGFSLRNMSLCVVDGVRDIWHRRATAAEPEGAGQRRANGTEGAGPGPANEVTEGGRLTASGSWSQRLRLSRSSHTHAHTHAHTRTPRPEQLEVQREGALRFMVADDSSSQGGALWQKCRLLLRRTSQMTTAQRPEGAERFLLEFYVPPKSSKPKVSIPLSAIVEVRTTMPLEMPDKDNTFVLKVENEAEYILETIDSLQKNSWVADIQDCIDPGDSGDDIELASCPHGQPSKEFAMVASCSCELLSEAGMHRAVERTCATAAEHYSTPSGRIRELPFTQHPSHIPLERFLQTPEAQEPPVCEADCCGEGERVSLMGLPWFHGTLSRVRAAQMVLGGGARSHGLFVIRQSETRPGEYVLTFNFQGKAKHLRLSVNENGQCHVHHLWFQTVCDMLRHFHTHPIPLESGGSAHITLRSYVQVQRDVAAPQMPPPEREPACRTEAPPPLSLPVAPVTASAAADAPLSSSSPSSPSSSAAAREGGSVGGGLGLHSRSSSSERLLVPPGGPTEDYHDSDAARRPRAVENQYSFY